MKKHMGVFFALVSLLILSACGGGGGERNHSLDIRNIGDQKIILSNVTVDGKVYLNEEMLLDLAQPGIKMDREYELSFIGGKKATVEYTLVDPKSRQSKTYTYTFTDESGKGGTFFIEFLNWKPIYKTSPDGKGVMPLVD